MGSRIAPGHMPRQRGERQSAALFQFITREEPVDPVKRARRRLRAARGTKLRVTAAWRRWRGRSGRRSGGRSGTRAGAGRVARILALVTLRAAARPDGSSGAATARIARPLVHRLPDSVFQSLQHLAEDETAIMGQGNQGRIGQHLDGVARIQANDAGSHSRCRTSTIPSSRVTNVVPSTPCTSTSKIVPRTEISAVGVVTLFGLGMPGRCWI